MNISHILILLLLLFASLSYAQSYDFKFQLFKIENNNKSKTPQIWRKSVEQKHKEKIKIYVSPSSIVKHYQGFDIVTMSSVDNHTIDTSYFLTPSKMLDFINGNVRKKTQ